MKFSPESSFNIHFPSISICGYRKNVNRHFIDKRFTNFHSTVSGGKVVTGIHMTSIEWKLNTTRKNSNNRASERVCGSVGYHVSSSCCCLAMVNNTGESGTLFKLYS